MRYAAIGPSNADGAIGTNVFENFLLTVDPHSLTFDLRPFPAATDRSAGAVRAYRADQLLLVNASLDNHPDRYFVVDTGSSFSALSAPRRGDFPGGPRIDIRGAAGPVDNVRRTHPMLLVLDGLTLLERSFGSSDAAALVKQATAEFDEAFKEIDQKVAIGG